MIVTSKVTAITDAMKPSVWSDKPTGTLKLSLRRVVVFKLAAVIGAAYEDVNFNRVTHLLLTS